MVKWFRVGWQVVSNQNKAADSACNQTIMSEMRNFTNPALFATSVAMRSMDCHYEQKVVGRRTRGSAALVNLTPSGQPVAHAKSHTNRKRITSSNHSRNAMVFEFS